MIEAGVRYHIRGEKCELIKENFHPLLSVFGLFLPPPLPPFFRCRCGRSPNMEREAVLSSSFCPRLLLGLFTTIFHALPEKEREREKREREKREREIERERRGYTSRRERERDREEGDREVHIYKFLKHREQRE